MRAADLAHGYESLVIAQALAEDELRARGRLRRLLRRAAGPAPVRDLDAWDPRRHLPRPRRAQD